MSMTLVEGLAETNAGQRSIDNSMIEIFFAFNEVPDIFSIKCKALVKLLDTQRKVTKMSYGQALK